MMKIILASASPRRKELLEQIGLEFVCHPAVGEEVISKKIPKEVVEELAVQKAEEVSKAYDQGIVIGADTVVSCEEQILGKPLHRQQAREMIELLQGRIHDVYTGVCLLHIENGEVVHKEVFAEKTQVEMFPMSESEIRQYIDSGEGDDKAGAYGIQGKCAAYIKQIVGDYNNVVGLPVGMVYQNIKKWL